MVRFLTILSLLFLFIQTGCIGPSKIKVTLNSRSSAVSGKAAATLSSVSIVNNQIVLSGENLNGVTEVRVSGPSVSETLSIESKSTTDLIANGTANIAFLLGGVFDLIISDARGAATYQVTFTLPNGSVTASKLHSMGANPAEVLTWTGSYWAPQPITGGLAYQGTFDPNTDGLPAGGAGEYYVASDTGTYDFGAGNVAVTAGEMIIHNGSDWEIVANGGALPSIGLIGDVDTTGAVNGSVLKYDGSNWVVGVDNNSGGGSGNWATSGSDSYLSSGVVAVGAAVDANTRLRLGSSYDSITGAFSGVDANSSGVTMVTSGTNGKFLDFTSDTGAFTGDVLFANMANGSGTFSGNFIQLQKNGVSQFRVSNTGMVTTNYLSLDDGALPDLAIRFAGNSGSGIYYQNSTGLTIANSGNAQFAFYNGAMIGAGTAGAPALSRSQGSASSPTYAFKTWTDTGFFAPADDNLAFSTQGLERVRINSSGYLGIGTQSPAGALDLASGNLVLNGNYISGDGGNEGISIDATGAVGFTRLSGAVSRGLILQNPATNAGSGVGVMFKTNTVDGALIETVVQSTTSYSSLVFSTRDQNTVAERMRIHGDGRLGIGTANPTAKLDIAGNIRIVDGTESDGYVLTTDSYGYASWQAASGGASQWITNISDIYYSTGNVGIGTTAPATKLSVSGGIARVSNGSNTWVDIGTESAGELRGYVKARTGRVLMLGGDFQDQLFLDGLNGYLSTTKFGVGTANPTATLDISGNLRLVDGQQAANKVLTSDTNGYASWQDPSAANVISSTTGYIAATNVNSAIAELEAEKLSLSGDTILAGTFDFSGASILRTNQTPAMLTDVTNVQYVQDALNDLWITTGSDVYRSGGNVGINRAPSANTRLDVNGQIVASDGTDTDGSINFSAGNAITTTFDCGSNISLANIRRGGNYLLVITGAGSNQCSFDTTTTGDDAATVSYRFAPANDVRSAGSHTLYNLTRVGDIVYISWVTGF